MVAYNKGECNPSTVVLHSDASRGSGGKPRDERFLLSGAEPGYETSARCSGWHAVENSSTVFVTFHFTFSDCIFDEEKPATVSHQLQSPGLHKCPFVWL